MTYKWLLLCYDASKSYSGYKRVIAITLGDESDIIYITRGKQSFSTNRCDTMALCLATELKPPVTLNIIGWTQRTATCDSSSSVQGQRFIWAFALTSKTTIRGNPPGGIRREKGYTWEVCLCSWILQVNQSVYVPKLCRYVLFSVLSWLTCVIVLVNLSIAPYRG